MASFFCGEENDVNKKSIDFKRQEKHIKAFYCYVYFCKYSMQLCFKKLLKT